GNRAREDDLLRALFHAQFPQSWDRVVAQDLVSSVHENRRGFHGSMLLPLSKNHSGCGDIPGDQPCLAKRLVADPSAKTADAFPVRASDIRWLSVRKQPVEIECCIPASPLRIGPIPGGNARL